MGDPFQTVIADTSQPPSMRCQSHFGAATSPRLVPTFAPGTSSATIWQTARC